MTHPERTPLNAPGAFFTGRGECMTCGAPEAEAPDLMAHDGHHGTCYFRRQPETPDELRQAIRAVCVACCNGVHYDGDDPAVWAELRRLDPHRYASPDRPRQPWQRRGRTA